MKYQKFCDKFFVALMAGDVETQNQMLADDFVVTEADGLPYAGTYRGPDGWQELAKAVVKVWSGWRLNRIEYLGETANSLVVRFAISGKSRKTGRSFDSTVMELWRFRNDRLCEILPYYWDTHLLVTANTEPSI